ncbi:MAG: hypothetical protein E6417_40135, partial [Bradyrhizobium sp.]|nr:hypothetical protein [Bradyrhizobium sp.]
RAERLAEFLGRRSCALQAAARGGEDLNLKVPPKPSAAGRESIVSDNSQAEKMRFRIKSSNGNVAIATLWMK